MDDTSSKITAKLEEYGGQVPSIDDFADLYSSALKFDMEFPQINGIDVEDVLNKIQSFPFGVPSFGLDPSAILKSIIDSLKNKAVSSIPPLSFDSISEWPSSAPVKIESVLSKNYF